MNIIAIHNVNYKYKSNIGTSNINYKKNIVFNGKDFISSSINSNINKAILNIGSKNSELVINNDIKEIMLSAKALITDIKKLELKYGKDINEKFVKGIQQSEDEYFIGKNPNYDDDEQDIDTYLNQFKNFSEEEKFSMITDFVNINDCKYINFWRKYPEILSSYINNTKFLPSQMQNFNSETWDAIIESMTKVIENNNKNEIIGSIISFSNDNISQRINFLNLINDLLEQITLNLDNKNFSQENYLAYLQKMIDFENDFGFNNDPWLTIIMQSEQNGSNILNSLFEEVEVTPRLKASYIKNTVLFRLRSQFNFDKISKLTDSIKKAYITSSEKEHKIKLWRDDSCSFFNIQEFEGELMGRYMKDALTDSTKREKLLTYFNTQNPEIERKTFLSTALKPFEFMKKDIKWNLKMGEGVKYLYIEPFKFFGRGEEAELLVHPCKLKINKAECCGKKWILDAEILPLKSY